MSSEFKLTIKADTEERAKAALDVFKEKLIRRDISMKAFDAGEAQPSGKTYKVSGTINPNLLVEGSINYDGNVINIGYRGDPR